MFAKTAVVAFFAAFAAAQLHAPVGDEPVGNPISRPLNEAVPAGKPFTITWTPTDADHTISILLLKGPSNNVVPVGEPIAEGIPNSGSYTWTPPATFGPGLSETTGYGIQIIDDVDGKYQYSTQFGITIPEGYGGPVSSATPSKSEDSYPTAPVSKSSSLVIPSSSAAPNTSTLVTSTKAVTSAPVVSTGYPAGNSSEVQPTGSLTVPSSLLPTPTGVDTNNPPESTGAASQLQAGLGLVAGVAGLFFML